MFYNAWQSVMGPVQKQLFCSRHVDRAWKTNLSKINDPEKRKLVYKSLKVLQLDLDEVQFLNELKIFKKMIASDPDTISFGKYFCDSYSTNFQPWAYCYRKGCGINTNMRVESMHIKTVKYFILGGLKVIVRYHFKFNV